MISSNFDKALQCKAKADIAILMATYNGAEFLNEQIDSILKQSAQNWELFVHDDGSVDQTVDILNKYATQYPQKIHILPGKSTGNAKENFFYLMEKVNANYIMFADQDDFWKKDKVETTYNKMLSLENNETDIPALIFSDLRVVDRDLKTISSQMSHYQGLKMKNVTFNHLMVQNVVTGCTVMINRKCKETSLACLERDNVIMHDWWCALVASYFGKIGYINDTLILYRQHGVNSVGAKNIHSLKYLKEKICEDREQKESLLKSEKQIATFIKSYNIKDEYIKVYSSLYKLSKFQKIWFLIQNRVWKSGLLRNLGLIYFC